jgi:hypothetical protein
LPAHRTTGPRDLPSLRDRFDATSRRLLIRLERACAHMPRPDFLRLIHNMALEELRSVMTRSDYEALIREVGGRHRSAPDR